MNGHVGDAVTGYFNFTLIDKRSKEHSIQSERKRKSKGKPLCSSEQWMKRGQEPVLERFLCLHAVEHDHVRAAKQNTVQWKFNEQETVEIKTSALWISSLDLTSNENIAFCFAMRFRFSTFVSTVFLIQQEMPTVMFVNIKLSCR